MFNFLKAVSEAKILLIVVFLVASGILYLGLSVYNAGKDYVKSAITGENYDVLVKATQIERNIRECDRIGGVYDDNSGWCK